MSTILAGAVLALGAFIVLSNWAALFVARKRGGDGSTVPLVGGLLLVVGLSRFSATASWAWLGLFADYTTFTGVAGLVVVLREAWRTSRFSLLHRFVHRGEGRAIELRLFEGGRFTVQIEHDPPVPHGSAGSLLASTSMVGDWRPEGAGFVLRGHRDGRTLHLRPADGGMLAVEDLGSGTGNGADAPDWLGGLMLERT